MKKSIVLLGFLIFQIHSILACSCSFSFFCDYVEFDDIKTVIKAKVIQHKEYLPLNRAAYLEVIKIYKGNEPITDTIKIYGTNSSSSCDINVFNSLPIGKTFIIAIRTSLNGPNFVNPDFQTENYWQYKPYLCDFRKLRIVDGLVRGPIQENIIEYPLELFDDHMKDCSFSEAELIEERCAQDNFIVFPNPSTDGKVFFKNNYIYHTFERVRVFSIDGRLLGDYSNLQGNSLYEIELKNLQNGVNIVEINCGGYIYYKKVMVNK